MVPVARGEIHWYRSKSTRASTIRMRRKTAGTRKEIPLVPKIAETDHWYKKQEENVH